jgi:hypothetical protein
LKKENIKIYVTHQKGQETTIVGFFTNIIPREDMLPVHDRRIRKVFNKDTSNLFDILPGFINVKKISAKVMIIRSNETYSVDIAARLDRKFNRNNQLNFYPWGDYSALDNDQKLTIIHQQSTFLDTYRSIPYTGYNEFDEDIVLGTATVNKEGSKRKNTVLDNSEDTVPTEVTTTTEMTLRQYINSQFKTVEGTPLFFRTYSPSKNTIEVLVHKSLFQQAKKITNTYFRSVLRTVIPDDKLYTVFRHPEVIPKTEMLPSTILRSKLAKTIHDTPYQKKDSVVIEKKQLKNQKKLIIFDDDEEALQFVSTQTPTINNTKKDEKITQPNEKHEVELSSPPKKRTNVINDKPDVINDCDNMTITTPVRNNKNKEYNNNNKDTYLYDRLEKLELERNEDRQCIWDISCQLNELQEKISVSVTNIGNMQKEIAESIETRVETNFNAMYSNFEEKIDSTLAIKVKEIELSTDSKFENLRQNQLEFRNEHQRFVEEFRFAQQAAQAQQAQTEAIFAMLVSNQPESKQTPVGRVTRKSSKQSTEVQHIEDGLNSMSDANE